jgi:UDP-glucose 4-epimerase
MLTRAMADAGVSRLVFSSTASVYGDQAKMPLTEESPLAEPASAYGRSKRMVEKILKDLAASDPRWSIGILRYFNPVGAHPSGQIGEDPHGVPANLIPFAMQVAVGRREVLSVFGSNYPTPDGTGMRDYIHIMDLASGHVAALNWLHEQFGYHIWNLGTGCPSSVFQIIEGIEQVTGQPLPWQPAPRRPGDVAQCWADPALAAEQLGWRAQRSLQEMLADHWRWQKLNPSGYVAQDEFEATRD